jgi:hypothetical protein
MPRIRNTACFVLCSRCKIYCHVASTVLPWLYLCRTEENWSTEQVEKFRSLVQLVEGAGRLGISRYIHLKPNHNFFLLSQNLKVKILHCKINLTCSLQNSQDYGGNTENMQSGVSITIANFGKKRPKTCRFLILTKCSDRNITLERLKKFSSERKFNRAKFKLHLLYFINMYFLSSFMLGRT